MRSVACSIAFHNSYTTEAFPFYLSLLVQLFLRGKPHLQKYMRRLPKTHKKLPMKKKDEPDFYKLDSTNPLPEVHEAPVPGAAATVQAMRANSSAMNPPNASLTPLSHRQGSAISSSIVTPNLSPNNPQTIIGGQGYSNVLGGGHGGSNSNNMNYMGSPSSGMNFMNSAMSGGMMPNSSGGGFNPQGGGSMGMMMGGPNYSSMGSAMMGGMSDNGGTGGGIMSMPNMNNPRFSNHNDMGGPHHDDFDALPLEHQPFSMMNQMNGNGIFGNGGYGNGGQAPPPPSSYNNVPPSPSTGNMRRTTMPMQGQGSVERTPPHQQQQAMPSDMFTQAYAAHQMPMQDMMYGHGGASASGNKGGRLQQEHDPRSASPSSGMKQQQQQQRQPSPSHTTV